MPKDFHNDIIIKNDNNSVHQGPEMNPYDIQRVLCVLELSACPGVCPLPPPRKATTTYDEWKFTRQAKGMFPLSADANIILIWMQSPGGDNVKTGEIERVNTNNSLIFIFSLLVGCHYNCSG